MKKEFVLIGLICCMSCTGYASQELPLYSHGKNTPTAYIVQDSISSVNYIFDYQGNVLAYIKEDEVNKSYALYNCQSGEQVGQFKGGNFYDLNRGAIVGIVGSANTKEPHKSMRKRPNCKAASSTKHPLPDFQNEGEVKNPTIGLADLLRGNILKENVSKNTPPKKKVAK